MKMQEMMSKIRLPEETQEEVLQNVLAEAEYQEYKELFYRDNKRFFEIWDNRENRFQWILPFYIRLACEVYEKYQEKGISDQIFTDTFYDITIWNEECYRKYSVYGLEEAKWVANSINMKLFRLGRLQFEPIILEKDLCGEKVYLPKGSRVLNMHIPAGEKMDYNACLNSIEDAKEFFGDTYEAYMCDSWLLSPVLKEFLSEDSNIVKFQNLFEIMKVYHDYPQAEQRIFLDVQTDKEKYPENSSLQREAKRYILEGKDLGIGIGAFYK